MVAKVLFALGTVAALVGAWQGSLGLGLVGVLWFVIAFPAAHQSRRLRALVADGKSTGQKDRPAVPIWMVLISATLFLTAGIPAVVVGLTGWKTDDDVLRWLPLIVGGIITVLAIGSTLLFLLGSGLFLAASGLNAAIGPEPTVPARIVVVSSRDTGVYVNNLPRLELVLDVTPEGMDTYRVAKKATVPFAALGGIQPGGTFEATVVGADHPTSMDIDWSTVSGPGPSESVEDRLTHLDALLQQGLVTAEEHASQRRRILDAL